MRIPTRSPWIVLSALLLLEANAYSAPPAHAKREVASASVAEVVSARSKNKLGGYLAFGEPAPTLLGVNLAYNVTDFLRASVGYGKLSMTSSISISSSGAISTTEASASTFGFGVRGFVPGWNFSPTAGLHFATISYSGTGLEVGGFKESGSHVYGTLGFDWQSDAGLNLSAGYMYSFRSGIGGSAYVTAGWFVNWLG